MNLLLNKRDATNRIIEKKSNELNTMVVKRYGGYFKKVQINRYDVRHAGS